MDRLVFISYSSTDKAAADACCAALESAGHACWIAPRDIEPGADYPAAILSGLHKAHAVVVIVTPAAVASPHILSEVAHAFGKMPIIPFRLGATDLPPDFDYFLSLSQWLDAHDGCTQANLARLTEAVTQALAAQPAGRILNGHEPGEQASAETPRKRLAIDIRMLLGGAALLLAIGAAGYFRWHSASNNVRKQDITDGKTLPTVDDKTSKGIDSKVADTKLSETKPEPWVNPKDGLTYVWIPPGTFTMGCSPGDTQCDSNETPSHLVELPNGYRMGQTEVTNAAYRRVIPSAKVAAGEEKLPVIGLSRDEAKAYCAAVGGRLPTEAEWEYAARGGIAGAYYGVPSKIAWYGGDSEGVRHEVATKQPNAYGLYDTLGNASEWVLDRYYNKYDIEAPAIGNVDQPVFSNSTAVTRGGYWESEVANIRVSRRVEAERDEPAPMAGVRCAIDRK